MLTLNTFTRAGAFFLTAATAALPNASAETADTTVPKSVASIQGVTLDSHGKTVGNASVQILAWPTSSARQRQTLQEVASTKSDNQGRFKLSIDNKKASDAGILNAEGPIDIDIISTTPAGEQSVFPTSASLSNKGSYEINTGVTKGPSAQAPGVPGARYTSEKPETHSPTSTGAAWRGTDLVMKASVADKRELGGTTYEAPGPTQRTGIGPVRYVNGIVGQASSTTGDGHYALSFTYSEGGSSSLGIGLKAPGGVFSQSGTESKSTSVTMKYAPWSKPGTMWYRSGFAYREFGVFNNVSYWVEHRPIRGASGTAGTSEDPSATPFPGDRSHCSQYRAGDGFTISGGSATNWTNGLSVPTLKDGDLSLSSQSGYSRQVSLEFTSNSVAHNICGPSSAPSGSSFPDRVQVRSGFKL